MIFDWNDDKNKLLLTQRNVCFEDVVNAVSNGKLLGISINISHNFINQRCMVVEISGYAYVIPFAENKKGYFLKTIFPSRKQTKKYFGSNDEKNDN